MTENNTAIFEGLIKIYFMRMRRKSIEDECQCSPNFLKGERILRLEYVKETLAERHWMKI